MRPAGGKQGGNGGQGVNVGANINDSFSKHYNKELKVSGGTYFVLTYSRSHLYEFTFAQMKYP